MPKVFAFDLDGTLTQHKTPLDPTNRAILEKLAESYTLLMVGAGSCERIYKQLGMDMDIIGNYGMQYAKIIDGRFTLVRDDVLPCTDRQAIEDKVTAIRQSHGFTEFAGDNVEYHASGCLTFPILGTKAVQADKLAFDPDRKKRRAFYEEVCETFADYNVFVGGSSSFDMAPKPYDKYYALDRYCRENGLSHEDVIYVGDDYGLGGNDESVYRSDFRFLTTDDYTRLGEVLAPWLDESVPDIAGLLGTKENCPCGMTHACTIGQVVIRRGAINELPALARDYRHIVLVCDTNTWRVGGERAAKLLGSAVERTLIYESEGFLVPNEDGIEKLDACLSPETDLIVGVGSGVINDLCKYVSYDHKLPYFIVATAPSMDGYASDGAAMILGRMKITTRAHVPAAIIGDTEILREAPIEMLRAGYGDIIGKFSCLNDWRLSHVINGEPLCTFVYDLTMNTVKSVAGMGRAIASRDEESIGALMRALIMVGICMSYMKNSRPASGSEHHLSHFFEVVGLLRGEPYFCHGVDVAYSTKITAGLRRELLAVGSPEVLPFDHEAWADAIRRVYTSAADGIIALQEKLGWIYEDKSAVIREKWDEIRAVLADSPSEEEISAMLCDVGLDEAEFRAMYSEGKLADAVKYAKDLKDRYTVLWLYNSIRR